MRTPVCISFVDSTISEIQEIVASQLYESDLIEIYSDFFTEQQITELCEWYKTIPQRMIMTFRRPGFAPTIRSVTDQKRILQQIEGLDIKVDLDIEREKDLLTWKEAEKLSIPTIASYHAYTSTPSEEQLLAILRLMEERKPEHFKFACLCQNDEDGVVLIKLLETFKHMQRNYIVTGMGEIGKSVRLMGALSGNAWTYVALDGYTTTAEGQFTLKEFTEISALLPAQS